GGRAHRHRVPAAEWPRGTNHHTTSNRPTASSVANPNPARQPAAAATAGRKSPLPNAANCTPDCLIPTAIPRRSAGTSPATSRLVAGFASACPTPARATATTNQRYDWAREAIDIAPTITVARARSPRRSPTTSTTCPVTSDIPSATPNMTETSSPSAARDSSHCSVRNGANTLTEYSPSGGIAIPAVATPVETCHRLATPPP